MGLYCGRVYIADEEREHFDVTMDFIEHDLNFSRYMQQRIETAIAGTKAIFAERDERLNQHG